jgi:hypothetical protein
MKPGHTITSGTGARRMEQHITLQTAIAIVGLQARLPRKWWATMSSHFLASEGGWALRRGHGVLVIGTWAGTRLEEWCIAAGDGAWKVAKRQYIQGR